MYLHLGQDTSPLNHTPILPPDPQLRWKPCLTPNLNPALPQTTRTDPRPNCKSHPAPTFNTFCDPVTTSVPVGLHARLGLRVARALASFIQKDHTGPLVAASLCPSLPERTPESGQGSEWFWPPLCG